MAFASLMIGSVTGFVAAVGAFVWLGLGLLGAFGIYSLVGALTTLALILMLYWRNEVSRRASAGAADHRSGQSLQNAASNT